MSKYSSKKYQFPVSLDEVGINSSLLRLKDESLDSYRRRISLHVKDLPTPVKQSVLSSHHRTVGLFEKHLLKITLVLDAEQIAIAPDPRIEIKSNTFKVWSNWNNGEGTPEVSLKIGLREEVYFVRDLLSVLSSLSFISVEVLPEWEDYLKTGNLKIKSTDKVTDRIALSNSRLNKLWVGKFEKAYFSNANVYRKEVSSLEDISGPGDYYINYERGYIYSHSPGAGDVSVDYQEFPFYLTWQPIKMVEVNDETFNELTRDYLVDDDGVSKRLLLNHYGASIANKALKKSPINWGE
jgi:hypothetical protein